MIALALALLGAQLDCENAVTQPDLNTCASADYRRADDALNRQWRITLEEMRRRDQEDVIPTASGTTRESRLRAAQRAWLAFRDAHCDSAYYAEMGAQLAYTMHIMCHRQMTEERTRQLTELMGDEP